MSATPVDTSPNGPAPPREELRFPSTHGACSAWWYGTTTNTPAPLVIMGHGLGATRELGLEAYALRFQRAGFQVLAFDYRHYGTSEGAPRELLSIRRQLEDWRAAIAFAKSQPLVDSARIALWGSSFGGGHVLTLASEGLGVAAVIAQVPFANGLASTLCLPLFTSLRLLGNALWDLASSVVGGKPHYVALLGRPGDVALMSSEDAYDGYMALVPDAARTADRWRNRVSARVGLAIPFYFPGRRAHRINVPTFLAVAARDSIAPASATRRIARKIRKVTLHEYPDGHFDYYTGSGFERAVTDELTFLTRHLTSAPKADAATRP